MVLDSSAIVAIYLEEPGNELLLERIESAEIVIVGVPTLLESTMVLTSRFGRDARSMLSAFLRRWDVQVVAFNRDHLEVATSAFLRYGRGRHPAALNFGDCMAYAVASVAGMPLLFVGEDFRRTDITPA